ncbi:protease HtpX [Mycobacterium heckeshornense]|uniref:M56 family metallopeptidase n=1 Tax=Mycobacterium heckeshornense TaxID=110505 RepID=UPI001945A86E|nr:M56 family metallopeptidase [Mycobacterium heckeshornense]BCQ07864.1 protease HtpX [Mycobacterium heckeshornense]
MPMLLCVATLSLLTMSVVPPLLDRLTPGVAPMMRLAAWLATLVTVLGAVMGLPAIVMASGRAVTATVLILPMVLVAQRIRRRYAEFMHNAHEHAQAVNVISCSAGEAGSKTRVVTLDSALPLVYSLPGRPGLVVTTTGVRRRLSSAELQAVLAHEEAHLRQRHAELRAVVEAVAATLWWSRFFRCVAEHVTAATELCADSAAARHHHPHTLARALLALAPAPTGALGAALTGAAERLEQLLCRPQRNRFRQLVVALTAVMPAVAILTIAFWCPLMTP